MTSLAMSWSDDLLTGDREIDGAHRAFFDRVKALARACKVGKGAAELDAALAFLYDYAASHFASEEAKMAAISYPYLATHIAAHRAFNNKLEELQDEADHATDKEAVAAKLAAFSTDWFSRHVKLVDRPFIEYLRGDRS